MKLLSQDILIDEKILIEKIESGETLLFLKKDGTKYLVDREATNNKNATSLNCNDSSIESFDIDQDILFMFGADAMCFTDVKIKIHVN